jgi:hypothetical protein
MRKTGLIFWIAARRLHQLAQRHVSALAADFAAYHTHFA